MALKWYCYQTKPNAELRAHERLENQGFQVHTFMSKRRVVRGGRVKNITLPLFRSYGLIRLDSGDRALAEQWAAINHTRSVQNLLPNPMAPSPISDGEIERLQVIERKDGFWWGRPVPGKNIRVANGGLAGQVMRCLAVNDARGTISALWHCFGTQRVVNLRADDVVGV
jgi:transcription antitermination factor NusG